MLVCVCMCGLVSARERKKADSKCINTSNICSHLSIKWGIINKHADTIKNNKHTLQPGVKDGNGRIS